MSAVERLEVYANAYFYRIRDCLIEKAGVMAAEAAFDVVNRSRRAGS